MKIYTVKEILNKLENCIEYKKSFSHIRFGDGGVKFLHSILYGDIDQLKIIVKKEGLPRSEIVKIFELWGYFARRADFIDTPEVYFTGEFWPRLRKPTKGITDKTAARLMMWKELYNSSEFDNENYCNPESNYLMILRREGKRNLLDVMKGRKICLITVFPEIKEVLRGYDIDILKIAGHFENQYDKSFENIVSIIKKTASQYDLWLVAAGELGRIYSGIIKECGGRTIDIGFVIEFFLGQPLHPRLKLFMERSMNPLELVLTNEGKKYDKYI